MDINRIQREFSDAQKSFAYVNLYPTLDGKVYVKAALTAASQTYVFSIKFPDTYPNEMPKIFIETPAITTGPHRYNTGNVCYLHPSMWNPGIHDLKFVIARIAKWLNKHEIWKRTGFWPGKEVKH
jgi:ubiquitin-protein ligase